MHSSVASSRSGGLPRAVLSGRLASVVEPLPGWAKVFFGVIALLLIGGGAWWLTGGNEGRAIAAAWRVDPGAELGPETREIPIIVNEAECASGRSADGRIEVDVTYEADTVNLEVAVRRLSGDQDCQSNPDTDYVVGLEEQLGDRTVAGEDWPEP